MWKLWCKALGEKASHKNHEADYVAIVRTFIFLTYLITNIFIISGVLRHWNDKQNEVPSNLQKTEKERILQTDSRRFSVNC
jgi:hypothetical protein